MISATTCTRWDVNSGVRVLALGLFGQGVTRLVHVISSFIYFTLSRSLLSCQLSSDTEDLCVFRV